MAVNVQEMKEHYQENLKPEPYNQAIVGAFLKIRAEFTEALQALYVTLKSGKYAGKRLLEIGSGATVHNIASASAYFEEIVQSDYVDTNCEELKKWLKGESSLDWTEPLKTVAEIEGYSDLEKGVHEITSRIRDRVKDVVHCDVLSDQVIPLEAGEHFDLIITSLTLEAAAQDFESFVDVLKRLHKLLRRGGGLLMVGFLNGDKWQTGDHEFPYLRVSKSNIDRALDLAEFGDKHWTVIPKTSEDPGYEYDSKYFVSSTAL